MLGPTARTGLLSLGALLATAAGCDDLDVYVPLPDQSGPAGVLDGALVYSGPRPCTKDGRIVGAAIVLAWDTRALPPPEGLGASAASLDVVPGEELFGGLRESLPFSPDGALVCPAPDDPPVTVSGSWMIAPLPAGTYQIRGFYDHDGDFDPGFSIANLPTQGDVAGGAIENAAEVLAGRPPRYREITLGAADEQGELAIPARGARVSGVAVSLGVPLPLERPIFHVSELLAPSGATPTPKEIVMPSDFQLETFSPSDPAATEASLLRLRLTAGLPRREASQAAKPPLSLPVDGAHEPTITYSRMDVNGDGALDAEDHILESAAIPALFPISTFTKLEDDEPLVRQAAPTVILQGLTIYKDLATTAGALASDTLNDAQESALVGIRPAALCLHPTRGAVLVMSHARDKAGNAILPEGEVGAVEAALSAQLGRPISITYGCLPEGRYALNLLYGTGQAWTLPNEAGVCAPSEEATSQAVCGQRPRLASQDVALVIGPPDDPAYCEENPTPASCGAP